MKFKYCLNESVKTTVQPKNKSELMKIIKDTIKREGNNCDLNFIDTSKITDMSELFFGINYRRKHSFFKYDELKLSCK